MYENTCFWPTANTEHYQTSLYSPPSKMKNSVLVAFIGIPFSMSEVEHLKFQLYLSIGFCHMAIAIDLGGPSFSSMKEA